MNRKVILYISMSLDGFIAKENGSVDWLSGHSKEEAEDNSYSEFIKDIDTILMGSKTYYQIVNELSPNKWVYKDIKSYVAVYKPLENNEHVTFISNNIVAFVKSLKKETGKNIWIVGGASIANLLIKENLIDEYHIAIIPTILGNGIRLFKNNNPEIKLFLENVNTINGITMIKYSKR